MHYGTTSNFTSKCSKILRHTWDSTAGIKKFHAKKHFFSNPQNSVKNLTLLHVKRGLGANRFITFEHECSDLFSYFFFAFSNPSICIFYNLIFSKNVVSYLSRTTKLDLLHKTFPVNLKLFNFTMFILIWEKVSKPWLKKRLESNTQAHYNSMLNGFNVLIWNLNLLHPHPRSGTSPIYGSKVRIRKHSNISRI